MTRLKIPEKQIENSILNWLNMQRDCFAWKNQSVGIYDKRRGVYRKGNNRHHINGVSDILGVWQGRFLAVEVKSARGKPTQDQLAFIQKVREAGGIAFVARSIEDCERELKTA